MGSFVASAGVAKWTTAPVLKTGSHPGPWVRIPFPAPPTNSLYMKRISSFYRKREETSQSLLRTCRLSSMLGPREYQIYGIAKRLDDISKILNFLRDERISMDKRIVTGVIGRGSIISLKDTRDKKNYHLFLVKMEIDQLIGGLGQKIGCFLQIMT